MTLNKDAGIVFDAGPFISMTLSGTLWVLEALKKKYKGQFYITPAVKKEIIDRPLTTKKYKFESIRVMPYLANGTITLIDNKEIENKTKEILELANNCFFLKNKPIKILHDGETESIAACLILGAKTIVIDERTTRYLIEAPEKIKKRLERKLHSRIEVDSNKLKELNKEFKEIIPIRSTELLTIAFEKELFNFYKYSNVNKIDDFDKTVLEGILWALKLNGCAILDTEINEILKIENKNFKKQNK